MSDANIIKSNSISKLNYIELLNNFWRINYELNFSPVEKSIYFAILHTSNILGWKNPFNQSNDRLALEAGMGESAFRHGRQRLVDAGLITYTAGNGRRKNGVYFIVNLNGSAKGSFKNTLCNNVDNKGSFKNTLSSSETNAYIKQETETKTIYSESEKFDFRKELINYGINKKLVDEWMLIRKAKKAINTQTAYKNFISQLEKTGKPPDEVFQIIIDKQWKGFEAGWLGPPKPKPQKGNLLQFKSKF